MEKLFNKPNVKINHVDLVPNAGLVFTVQDEDNNSYKLCKETDYFYHLINHMPSYAQNFLFRVMWLESFKSLYFTVDYNVNLNFELNWHNYDAFFYYEK